MNSQTEYENWLVNDQLEDTKERREAFDAGWNYAWDLAQEKIKRALE
jgi:hypothetical protein